MIKARRERDDGAGTATYSIELWERRAAA
jgi:hypothetical protein